MAVSKEGVVDVCHLRYNSWLSLPQGTQDPNRLHGRFFFAKGPTPILAAHHPHPTHLTEYWQQIDLIHDTCHLCTPIRIDEIKAMSRGFSGGKQVKIICKCKILRSSTFILDNRK